MNNDEDFDLDSLPSPLDDIEAIAVEDSGDNAIDNSPSVIDLITVYRRSISTLPRLTDDEAKALIAKMHKLSPKSKARRLAYRNQIVEGNLHRVMRMAFTFGGKLPVLTRIQVANLALVKVVDTFTFNTELPFDTYLRRAVKNALIRAKAKQGHAVSLEHTDIWNVRRAEKRLAIGLPDEDTPTHEEIAKAARITPLRLERLRHATTKPRRLDDPVGRRENRGGEDLTVEDVLPQSTHPSPDSGLDIYDDKMQVQDLLDGALPPLTTNERTAFTLKRGLADVRREHQSNIPLERRRTVVIDRVEYDVIWDGASPELTNAVNMSGAIERTNEQVAYLMNVSTKTVAQWDNTAWKKIRAGVSAAGSEVTAVQVENWDRSALYKVKAGAKQSKVA